MDSLSIGAHLRNDPPRVDRKMKPIGLLAFLIGASVALADTDYNDWIKHFYQTQDVAQFDGYWQMVVKDKMLLNRNQVNPVIGFSSQVLHRHPSLIKGHIDNLASFPEAERESVIKLLWLSDTEEAREILRRSGAVEFAQKAPPPIGAWKIGSGQDLDLCWGSFFATGDTAALDPIISALDFGQYAGALKRYKAGPGTEEDRQAAIKDAIFGAAMWSLGVNGREDHRIAKHIGILFFDPQTPKPRKIWLGTLFAEVSPNIPRQELEDDKAGR